MILPHATAKKILLISDEGGWVLPHFIPIEHHFGVVSHINQAMQSLLGVEVTVLRCVYNHVNRAAQSVHRVYVLENHSPRWIPPANACWVGAEEINYLTLVIPEHRTLLKAWFAQIEKTEIAEKEVPWALPGWFDAAKMWIYAQLERLEIKACFPIEQVKSWALACVLRLRTTVGTIYFKATPELFSLEPEFTKVLAKYYPDNLPLVLATNSEKHWILMQNVDGKPLQKFPALQHWEAALHEFAKIQIDSLKYLDIFLAKGWLELRIERLYGEIYLLFKEAPFDIRQLLPFVCPLVAMLEKLASLRVPHTLVHGDLSPRNIYVTEKDKNYYVYLDWSDSCISHPFFDLVRFLYEIEMDLPEYYNARERLRNAYLEPWKIYEPMERLIPAFEQASETLVSIYEAISERQLLQKIETQLQWSNKTAVTFYIQRLLVQISTYLKLSLKGN